MGSNLISPIVFANVSSNPVLNSEVQLCSNPKFLSSCEDWLTRVNIPVDFLCPVDLPHLR
jgi:hypothetical protein